MNSEKLSAIPFFFLTATARLSPIDGLHALRTGVTIQAIVYRRYFLGRCAPYQDEYATVHGATERA